MKFFVKLKLTAYVKCYELKANQEQAKSVCF